MSFGIQFSNKYGNVLISSETKTLHFYGRFSTPISSEYTELYDGVLYDLGRAVWVFEIPLSTAYTPVPFFTIPHHSVYDYAQQYIGITRIWQYDGKWRIEVLSNMNFTPELYIFTQPAGAPSYGDYGITVRDRNGSVNFDSAKAPLVPAGEYSGFTMAGPPANATNKNLSARNGSSLGNAQFWLQFMPTKRTAITPNTPLPNKPIFGYMSTPQAQLSVENHEYRRDCIRRIELIFDSYCVKYRDQAWISRYWTYYRTGISRQNAAWIPRDWNAAHRYKSEDGYYLLGFDIGSMSGLLDTDPQNSSGGKHPYENDWFNLEQPPIIFADAEMYDELID